MIVQLGIAFVFVTILSILFYTCLIQLRDAFFRVQKQANGYSSQWELDVSTVPVTTVQNDDDPASVTVELDENQLQPINSIESGRLSIPMAVPISIPTSSSPRTHQRNMSSVSACTAAWSPEDGHTMTSHGSSSDSIESRSPPSYEHCVLTPDQRSLNHLDIHHQTIISSSFCGSCRNNGSISHSSMPRSCPGPTLSWSPLYDYNADLPPSYYDVCLHRTTIDV